MGTSDRRERHRASLRREILDAASRLFVEEGYQRLTMRRLAERIEYSPTTIYLHFRDKDELLRAVCDETFSQLAGKLERIRKSSTSPLEFLREGLKTYVEFGLANPHQFAATFLRPIPAGKTPEFEDSAGAKAFGMLRQGVQACRENGDIRTPDVEMTAQSLWASVHGLTALLITEQGFPFVERGALLEHTIDTLVTGLKTPETAVRTPTQPKSRKWDYFN